MTEPTVAKDFPQAAELASKGAELITRITLSELQAACVAMEKAVGIARYELEEFKREYHAKAENLSNTFRDFAAQATEFAGMVTDMRQKANGVSHEPQPASKFDPAVGGDDVSDVGTDRPRTIPIATRPDGVRGITEAGLYPA